MLCSIDNIRSYAEHLAGGEWSQDRLHTSDFEGLTHCVSKIYLHVPTNIGRMVCDLVTDPSYHSCQVAAWAIFAPTTWERRLAVAHAWVLCRSRNRAARRPPQAAAPALRRQGLHPVHHPLLPPLAPAPACAGGALHWAGRGSVGSALPASRLRRRGRHGQLVRPGVQGHISQGGRRVASSGGLEQVGRHGVPRRRRGSGRRQGLGR